MAKSYPPHKTTRWYYLTLLWQVQHHIVMLPDETIERVVAMLTPHELEMICSLCTDDLRGLMARFLDDTQVLPLAEEHRDFDYTPQRLAALEIVRNKLLSLGYPPPVASELLERRNETLRKKLHTRLKTLGRPKKREQQVEQSSANKEIAEAMVSTLLLLPNRTIRDFVALLSEDERLYLTHWSSDDVKGVVYQFLTTQEADELEEWPTGPKFAEEFYAELAALNSKLLTLNPQPATEKQRERVEERNARLAQKVERRREQRNRANERKSLLDNYPNHPCLEQYTRRQVVEKIAHINCQCRRHTKKYDENYKPIQSTNPWLPKALAKEKNQLFRWGLEVILGKAAPDSHLADSKVRVREQKFLMLRRFCESIENKWQTTWVEIALLLNDKSVSGIDIGAWPKEIHRPSFDAYSRQELFDKLSLWGERFTKDGWFGLEEEKRQEPCRFLQTMLEEICTGLPHDEWLPVLEELYRNQIEDKRAALLWLIGQMADDMPSPHWVGSWGALCFQYPDTLRKHPHPLRNHWALSGCRTHTSPERHIYLPGGIDTLTPLQVARKVLSFAYAFRRYGADFLGEVITREQSLFFRECWELLLPAWEHFRSLDWCAEAEKETGSATDTCELWQKRHAEYEERFGIGRQLDSIGERWQVTLAENYRAALALFPYVGTTERFDERVAQYGSPAPAPQPDRLCSLEEFSTMELAARATAYHHICRRPASPLNLELSPLDLNLPSWTPNELELVPVIRMMLTWRVDGLDPEESERSVAAALPIILRREQEKIRMVTWGLKMYMVQGHGPGLLEEMYRYWLEGY
ncbi:MAG: hypothetical protein ACOYL3_23240 [Desulfuromonadaceae bacterium]